MTPINVNKAMSERNSFAPIHACGPWRVISAQTWLAGVLILLSFPNAFAQSDFSAFWQKFKSAVIAGDKATIAEMTKFPLSMPYGIKAVKNKEDFLRRYEIYCPFKETPNDMENAPIRFMFELTKVGWRFVGLDNINE